MSDIQQPAPTRKVSILLGIGIFFFPLIFAWFTLRKGYSGLAKGISFGWLIFSLIIVFNMPKAPQGSTRNTTSGQVSSSNEQASSNQVEFTKVSATDLFNAYEANEVAADKQFKGVHLEVTGTIERISSDFRDKAIVHLQTPNQFMGVQASGSDAAFEEKATQLSKGQKITLQCIGNGEVIGMPSLSDCSIM